MVFQTQSEYLLEMRVVDVGVHSEHPLEDGFYDLAECLRECHTNLARKYSLVVKLCLNPRHEQVYVLWGRHFQRGSDVLAICP